METSSLFLQTLLYMTEVYNHQDSSAAKLQKLHIQGLLIPNKKNDSPTFAELYIAYIPERVR